MGMNSRQEHGMMGKSFLNSRVSWSVYRYAPESFNASFRAKDGSKVPINLPADTKSHIGYLAVCGKSKEVMDELKRFMRKQTRLSAKIPKGVLGVSTTDGGVLSITSPYGRWYCGQYDIAEKLESFHALKAAYQEKRFAVEVKTATMTNYGEVLSERTEPVTQEMGRSAFIFWPN